MRAIFCRHLSSRTSAGPSRPAGRAAAIARSELRLSARSAARQSRPQSDFINTRLQLAAVGRANVGKSTLFNRLARAAGPFVPSVVDSFPGVTRDARVAYGAVGDLRFGIVDTAGLEDEPGVKKQKVAAGQEWWRKGAAGSVVDAGALEEGGVYRELYEKMAGKTEEAVKGADAALFVLDAGAGITAVDMGIARWLRAAVGAENVVVLVNKCDLESAKEVWTEAHGLGFGEPLAVSAEHNMGMADLYKIVSRLHGKKELAGESAEGENDRLFSREPLPDASLSELEAPPKPLPDGIEGKLQEIYGEDGGELAFDPDFVRDPPIHRLMVSIIGRPNVGKSSLLSCLVAHNSSGTLIGPASGVTRDAVLAEWTPPKFGASSITLVDTAGIRAKAKVNANMRVEALSVKAALRGLRLSHVTVLVIDATEGFVEQDVKIAHVAIMEGRAIVVAVNKMDCVRGDEPARKALRENITYAVHSSLHQISGVEVVEMSAADWGRSGRAQEMELYEAVLRAKGRWERRVPTSALTRFVTKFNATTSVGMSGASRNRRGETKFISQKKTRPPMFRLDGSSAVSDNYIKALTNGIRAEFGFEGVPIRIKRPSRRQRR